MTANLREFIQAAEEQREPGDETPHVFNLRMTGKPQPGSILLWLAAILLLGLAAAQGYVSYRAQFAFIDAAKHARIPSMLEALGLDTGAVIFALLGLAHARIGRPARIERTLNLACALGSMTMNLLGADLGSPRSVAVYVLPAVLYAACSDRLIATAAAAAGVPEASLWRFLGRGVLFGLRLAVAFPSTARGLRLRLLQATPLPGAEDPAVAELAAIATALLPVTSVTQDAAAQARAWCLGYEASLGVLEDTAAAVPGPVLAAVPQVSSASAPGDSAEVSPEDTQGTLPAAVSQRPRSRPSQRPRMRPRGRSRGPVTEEDAAREFAAGIQAGNVPGIREIKRRLHVGDTRAKALREHLEAVTASTGGR